MFFGTNIDTCVLYTGAYYAPRNTVFHSNIAYMFCYAPNIIVKFKSMVDTILNYGLKEASWKV